MSKTLPLSAEEAEFLQKFQAACDARAVGYADGMRSAKQLIVEQFLLITQKGIPYESPKSSDATEHAPEPKANDAPSGFDPSASNGSGGRRD